jgi:galactokinase
MAIDLGTTVTGRRGGDTVRLRSSADPEPAEVPIDVIDPAWAEPAWARYVAGVVAEVRPAEGFSGDVATSLPVGAGLSSSAALEVAVALALGFSGPPLDLALAAQRAEQRASGVPCGVMDQLTSAAGLAGHALRIDCTTLQTTAVPIPEDVAVVVIDSGQRRQLAGSEYGDRAAACRAAQEALGSLREAQLADLDRIDDAVLRKRARHVISENGRVDQLAEALRSGDRPAIRDLMAASHASLRDDLEVSTSTLDELVARVAAADGVIGARLTGAGFGGCVVALVEIGASLPDDLPARVVRPPAGARIPGPGDRP